MCHYFLVVVSNLTQLKLNREVLSSSSDEEDDDGATGSRRPEPPRAKARPSSSSTRRDEGPRCEVSPMDPALRLDFGHIIKIVELYIRATKLNHFEHSAAVTQ